MNKMIHGRIHLVKGRFELDAQLSIPMEGITAIFGPSGSGKTTLLRCMAGLESVSPESSLFFGDECWQDSKSFCPCHLRGVGYVFQDARLFWHLDVKQNLEFAQKRAFRRQDQSQTQQILRLTQVEPLLNHSVDTLSGGEKQRVALARTLLNGPRLLLLDEALASLDLAARKQLLACIEQCCQELQVPAIYVSHSLGEIASLTDQVLLMKEGRISSFHSARELLVDLDFVSSAGSDACAVIDGEWLSYDHQFCLGKIRFSAGEFLLPGPERSAGQKLRLRIAPRDVSVALTPPESSSILNILPCQVDSWKENESRQMLVKLCLGQDFLVSLMSKKSFSQLQIAKKQDVFAQIKGISLSLDT